MMPSQKVFYADVLVKVDPVEALAFADESPMISLDRSGVRESGLPR
jgi:hypothetical protein|tara:strand:+ start:3626 stop:3763 length:138 start_codon:yes stop_codon:yes gene_type:complete